MQQYKMRHKQTGEIVIGTFEEICDLDKRLWSKQELLSDEEITIIENTPLVSLQIVFPQFKRRNQPVRTHLLDVYSLSDLNNIYLGG